MLLEYRAFLLRLSALMSSSISLKTKSSCAGLPNLIGCLFATRSRMVAPVFLILALPSLTVAAEIPPELQGEPWRQITAQIEASRHEVRRVDGAWQAHTPAQDYVTEFTDAGPLFRLDDGEATHEIGLLLDSIDVDGQPVELAVPRIHAEGNKFEYQRGAVTEWYVNNPDGVRQWFRVDEAPAGDTLNVAMRLDSNLTAAMNGDELRLSEGNRTVARFAGLEAWDAQQVPLPASMRVEDGQLIVMVETEGASYPITIDPVMFSEVAKLTASDGAAGDLFGFSVSLSGDRALVGARFDDDNGSRSGSAYVFDLVGTAWSQTAKLTASDGAAVDLFGNSVSLSGDRALVGAPVDDDNGSASGSAYVFDLVGTAWSQTAKLTASDGAAGEQFGWSVSLSGDRALVGAINDDDNGFDSGSAYIFAANQAPMAQPDAVTVDEDALLNGDVLADNGSGPDFDPDGDRLTVTEVNGVAADVGTQFALASGALLTVNSDGSFDYDPNGQFESLGSGDSAIDSFDYTISDGQATDSATVTITINGVDDPPVAVDDATTITEDDPPTAIDVLANDTDIDGGPIAINSVTQPTGGTVTITGGASALTYQPDPNFCNDGTPTDDFSYTLAPGSSTATVAVTVTCVNDAPEADAGAATTDEDTAVTITLTGSDIDGDALTFAIATGPADGSLGSITSINETTAEVPYTPDADFNGSDSFTFMVNDGTVDSTEAAISITIDAVNDPPEVSDDSATTDEDTPVDIDVLANDNDIDGNLDPATVTVTNDPADGATSVNTTTGVITYTPTPDFNGDDAFTYEVCDDGAPTPSECASATVSITIDAVNDAPVADAGTTTTDEDSPVTITLTGSDVDGDALTFAIATGPADGSLSTITPINDTSADVIYTPDGDFNGNDSFTFTVNDGTVDSGAATVEITVDPVNDPPEADAGTATTDEDVPVTITLTGSDIDNDALTFEVATAPSSGSLGGIMPINDTTAEVTYTPNADFNGNDSFTFTVNDGTIDSDEATVEITVNAVNDPPEADSGTAKTDQNTPVTITLTGSDVDGDALTFAIATSPANGNLSAITSINDTTAEVTYTPDADFDDTDSFTFTVNDGTADSDEATVEVIVGLFADAFEQE